LSETVSTRNPFNVKFSKFDENGDLMLITSKGNGLYDSNKILKNNELIPKWKVMISKTSHDHAGQPDKNGKRRVLSKIEILEPNTICSETYLIVNCYSNEVETQNMVNFLKTKVVRFLISTVSLTQNLTKSSFQFVPKLDMNIEWSDEKLYTLFNLTDNEISFINEMIREY
jgi:site-specific DNA-methyltransferase (adenine-specific)